jgi:hypothetical protein
MDPKQSQFEQAVGDHFAEWLTATTGVSCVFLRRADRAPDLVYSYKQRELLIEITAAYYDGKHAEFLWKGARAVADAPSAWSGSDPDASLVSAIAKRVSEKSKKRYGGTTVLLIEVPPGITPAEELVDLLSAWSLPAETPFAGIYVVGGFPITSDSSGGYRVIPLIPMVLE